MMILLCVLLVGNLIFTGMLFYATRRSHAVRCSASMEIGDIKMYLQKWDTQYADFKRWHDTVAPILRRMDAGVRHTHDGGKDETCVAGKAQ